MTGVVVLAMLSLSTPIVAQQTKTDTYLMQVAAAVSGSSAGDPVYVVICGTRPPYRILGTYPTSTQATTAINATRADERPCSMEGPFSVVSSEPAALRTFGSGCKKGPDSSCLSDTSAVFIAALDQVTRVTISYTLRNGTVRTDSFNPRQVEAVFFTMAAADRMLVPYFVRVYGMAQAARQRQQLVQRFSQPTAP